MEYGRTSYPALPSRQSGTAAGNSQDVQTHPLGVNYYGNIVDGSLIRGPLGGISVGFTAKVDPMGVD